MGWGGRSCLCPHTCTIYKYLTMNCSWSHAGNPGTTNLISVFMITCPDGSVCPSNATEATLAKAARREVAEECCVYFQGGCCTAAENQQLVMW